MLLIILNCAYKIMGYNNSNIYYNWTHKGIVTLRKVCLFLFAIRCLWPFCNAYMISLVQNFDWDKVIFSDNISLDYANILRFILTSATRVCRQKYVMSSEKLKLTLTFYRKSKFLEISYIAFCSRLKTDELLFKISSYQTVGNA